MSGWVKMPDYRLNLPDYSARAIFEGLVNHLLCKGLHNMAYVKFPIMSSFATNRQKAA